MKIVENRIKFFIFSAVILLAGIIAMPINYFIIGNDALNFDVEFTGGTSIHINIAQDFNNNDIIQIIAETTGQNSPQVQKVLGKNEVMIKIQSVSTEQRAELVNKIKERYSLSDENILNVSDVSATISSEMQRTAIIAISGACLAMLIYVAIRFKDIRAGASAIIALMHDALLILAVYSIFRIPVNNSFIAAILTILGYSINATIVVFDRIRENKRHVRRDETALLVNNSINQTINRSINTSLTTLLTITCVYVFGVQSVREFAMPLIVGIIGGTYSSVFLSGSVWYVLMTGSKRKAKVQAK